MPQSAAITAARCRGSVSSAASTTLQPLFDALPDTPGLATIKQSTVRTVLCGRVGNIDLHLKIYRAVTLSDQARDRLRGDRGSREARNLTAASSLGLQTVEPLACGAYETDQGRRSFLVTRTVAAASPFSFAMPPTVLAAVGRMLRKAHDRGFLPADLHGDNLVIDAAGSPWLLDLSSVQRAGDPDLTSRAASLAFLCQTLDGGPVNKQAQPLLASYLAAGNPLPEQFGIKLAQAARQLRHRQLGQFGRRAQRPCKHTVLERDRRKRRWHLHQIEDRGDALHAACRAFLEAPPEPTKCGRRGAVWLLDDLAVKERQQGAARKLFEAMYWLRFAGVPQAEPVALATGHGKGHIFARRVHTANLAEELASGTLSSSDISTAATQLGRAVGRLHAHGLRNRDMKFENIVREPATGRICMVDLDGVRRKKPSDARGQGMDLGRLLAAFRAAGSPGGTAAILTFVRSYLRARKQLLQPTHQRRLWQMAEQRARQWATAHS